MGIEALGGNMSMGLGALHGHSSIGWEHEHGIGCITWGIGDIQFLESSLEPWK
jgi:hypothetical protein